MEKKIFLIILPLCLIQWHWFEPTARKNQQGIQAYQQKKYEEALNHFLSARGIKPNSAFLKNNTATALYQMKKFREAMDEFATIAQENNTIPKSQLYYNIGNTAYRLQQFDQALDYFKKSILLNPDDMNAKKNYELTKKQMQQQDQDQQPDQQEPQAQQPPPQNQMLQFLNQNEKDQMEKQKRKTNPAGRERDW